MSGLFTRVHRLRRGSAPLSMLLALACGKSPAPSELEAARVAPAAAPDAFVRVQGTRFVRDGRPFAIMGCNYWSAAIESRTEAGRARVARELDRLAAMGVNVVRVLALSEGPDSEPWRVVPSLQPSPGRFAEEGIAGLDWLMVELARRGLYGVFMLNNFWFWSGGMPQYVSWARGVDIPYPHPEQGGDWERYESFAAEFFGDTEARALFDAALRAVVPRYRDSPAVFAWELANEPHPRRHAPAFGSWVDETARLVHALDPRHLVTTGTEGDTPSPEQTGVDVVRDHASSAIDFVGFHVWPQNWGWVQAHPPQSAFEHAAERARRYVADHTRAALELGKPALLLETSLPRDGGAFEPGTAVSTRDRYLELIFEITLESASSGGALAGAFPWAWSGEASPERPGVVASQAPYTGDPPHERQGWYSIYASDISTIELMSRYAARFRAAAR